MNKGKMKVNTGAAFIHPVTGQWIGPGHVYFEPVTSAGSVAVEEKIAKGDYAQMTVLELRDYAEKKGIEVNSRMKKNDIIIAILEAEAG